MHVVVGASQVAQQVVSYSQYSTTDVRGKGTCSEMDIWSSGPRMATLPAMVVASVSKITLHEHFCISTGCTAHHLHHSLQDS